MVTGILQSETEELGKIFLNPGLGDAKTTLPPHSIGQSSNRTSLEKKGNELYKDTNKGGYGSLGTIKATEYYKLSKDGGWDCQKSWKIERGLIQEEREPKQEGCHIYI